MKAEVAKREIESLDYYLQNHTDDYGEESHTAMMMAISALSENKGEWRHDGSRWKNRFICSACGYKLFDAPTNYCPNCGARMKGGE